MRIKFRLRYRDASGVVLTMGPDAIFEQELQAGETREFTSGCPFLDARSVEVVRLWDE